MDDAPPVDRRIVLRTAFVLAILAIMPLMALPPVGESVRQLLHETISLVAPGSVRSPEAARSESGTPAAASLPTVDFTNVSSLGEIGQPKKAEPSISVAAAGEPAWDALIERLRESGADHWRLESDPQQRGLVRFECQVPLRESVYRRTFHSSGRDRLAVVQQVLRQVEQWVATRHPHTEVPPRAARSSGPTGLR